MPSEILRRLWVKLSVRLVGGGGGIHSFQISSINLMQYLIFDTTKWAHGAAGGVSAGGIGLGLV